MMGDYTGKADTTPLEERKPINIDKDNLNEVMAQQKLGAAINVADKLSGEQGAEMSLDLKFKTLADFTPEGIVNQVPELRKLLELRTALNALKGPLGNIPAFRKKIQTLLGDDGARQKLMGELGIPDGSSKPDA